MRHYKDAGMTFAQAQAHNRACDRAAKRFNDLFGVGLCLILSLFFVIVVAMVVSS